MKRNLIFSILMVLFLGLAASPKARTDSHSAFAEFDGMKVHYLTYGEGDTALVFIHGWSCDSTVWRYQVEALSPKIHTIAIDLPGHGQSDKPHIDYTMTLYARAIDAVLRTAGVKRAILVGHSNGTPVARQFYRKYPEKTLALVVVDGSLRSFFASPESAEKFLQPLRGPNYTQVAGQFIDSMVSRVKDPSLRPQIKSMMLATPQYVAVSEFQAVTDPAIWKEDKINVPVLVIVAKQPAWSPEYEQYVHSLIPDVEYRSWDGVSHFLMMDKPREFNDTVSTFLSQKGLAK